MMQCDLISGHWLALGKMLVSPKGAIRLRFQSSPQTIKDIDKVTRSTFDDLPAITLWQL
jgi:hypothetical protein